MKAIACNCFPETQPRPSAKWHSYLAELTIVTDANGVADFDLLFPASSVPGGTMTLTATRISTGDTSELAATVPAQLVLISGIPGGPIGEGTPVTLTTVATDPGPGETVSYESRMTKNGTPFDSGVESTFTFTPDDNGAFVVTLTVATSTGLSQTIPPIPITVTNRTPVIEIVGFPAEVPVGASHRHLCEGHRRWHGRHAHLRMARERHGRVE